MNRPRPEKIQGPTTGFSGSPGPPFRILVAPLDWGLGHATRCIPIIYALLQKGCQVWLAGEGAQETLLRTEFPQLPFLSLPGYRVRYGRSRFTLIWQLIRQMPRLRRVIREENNWLRKMLETHSFDAVISDNRYGLHHPSLPSIFITHQLHIKSPVGKWAEDLLQKSNYRHIRSFTACWVPDYPDNPALAGELSQPDHQPAVPTLYTGPLSRFQPLNIPVQENHLLILLSGPEPQRSLLENKIIEDISHYPYTATIVRGLPNAATLIPSTGTIRFYNHLGSQELNKEMEAASFVISRSGYSTIMDLATLHKKSILIPTPGQTEQEYLGRHLQQQQLAVCVPQSQFSLPEALQKAGQFHYADWRKAGPSLLDSAIDQLLLLLKK